MFIVEQLWKSIIEDFTIEAILFFFPLYAGMIDLSFKPEHLDKELQEIVPKLRGRKGVRHVDKLIKIRLKNGEYKWLLIHIEIQAQPQPGFSRRMFMYHIGIILRFKMEVVSLAIFTDNDPDFRPDIYQNEFWGTETTFKFPIYKLSDQTEEELMASDNPFATVMHVGLLAQKEQTQPIGSLGFMLKVARNLYKKGYSPEKTQLLLRFMEAIVAPTPAEKRTFDKVSVKEFNQKKSTMGVIEAIRQMDIEKGMALAEAKVKAAKSETQAANKRNRIAIRALYNSGTSISSIAELMDMKVSEVEAILKKKI